MIVMKFGGTSVESRKAIERVAGIVRDRLEHRPVVVVSAMGRTTNKLLAIASVRGCGRIDAGSRLNSWYDQLRELHLREAHGLGVETEVSASISDELERIGGSRALR